MASHPVDGSLLLETRHGLVTRSVGYIVGITSTNDALHVVGIELELSATAAMEGFELVVLPIGLCGPFLEVAHHTLQVEDGIVGGLDTIVGCCRAASV